MLTNKQKKWLGWIILAFGISMIFPIPDPLDVVGFSLFSVYKGIDVDVANVSLYYFDYLILTSLLGFIFILIGMNILGLTWKRVWKKIDPGKYRMAILIAIFCVVAIGVFDFWSMASGVFGTPENYTNGDYTQGWWELYFKFVLMFFAIPSVCYYLLVNKDISESIGVYATSIIMFFGGLADIVYFIAKKSALPSELPWLTGSPFINFVSTKLLGHSTVTNVGLVVSVVLSFMIVLVVTKILKEKF